MKMSGIGLPNGFHMNYISYSKRDLIGSCAKYLDIYMSGKDIEDIKMLRFISNTTQGNNITDFNDVMVITSIDISLSMLDIKEVYDSFKQIADYFKYNIILIRTSRPINIGKPDTDKFDTDVFVKRAMFIELFGFRSLRLVCDCQKSSIPYLYINDTSMPLIKEILKIEMNNWKS